MSSYREPLAVPAGRTLLALHHWPEPRTTRARPTLQTLAVMDFLLRFPVALEAVFSERSRKLPMGTRPTSDERAAYENEQLLAQLVQWPSRHRLVTAGLLGRRLARIQPAIAGTGMALTARGAEAALELADLDEWHQVDIRARALARSLRVGAPQLRGVTERALAGGAIGVYT